MASFHPEMVILAVPCMNTPPYLLIWETHLAPKAISGWASTNLLYDIMKAGPWEPGARPAGRKKARPWLRACHVPVNQAGSGHSARVRVRARVTSQNWRSDLGQTWPGPTEQNRPPSFRHRRNYGVASSNNLDKPGTRPQGGVSEPRSDNFEDFVIEGRPRMARR